MRVPTILSSAAFAFCILLGTASAQSTGGGNGNPRTPEPTPAERPNRESGQKNPVDSDRSQHREEKAPRDEKKRG